uniref:Uncharacterized protein n=1 Tax=Anguilla anguilla TaxID=7936 RepID=A0A0E9V8D4_ANGAN
MKLSFIVQRHVCHVKVGL